MRPAGVVRRSSRRFGHCGFGPRLDRLRINGLLELEVLIIGIDGKKTLWRTLGDLAGLRDVLPDVDFDQLVDRLEQQRSILEPLWVSRDGGVGG